MVVLSVTYWFRYRLCCCGATAPGERVRGRLLRRRPWLVPVRSLPVIGRSLARRARLAARVPRPEYAVRSFDPDVTRTRGWRSTPRRSHTTRAGVAAAGRPRPADGRAVVGPGRAILVVEAADPDSARRLALDEVGPPGGEVGEVYVVGGRTRPAGAGPGRAVTVLGPRPPRSLGLDRRRAATSTRTTSRPCAPTPPSASRTSRCTAVRRP